MRLPFSYPTSDDRGIVTDRPAAAAIADHISWVEDIAQRRDDPRATPDWVAGSLAGFREGYMAACHDLEHPGKAAGADTSMGVVLRAWADQRDTDPPP